MRSFFLFVLLASCVLLVEAAAQTQPPQGARANAPAGVVDQVIPRLLRPPGPPLGSRPLDLLSAFVQSGDALEWRIDLASGVGPGLATARAAGLDEEGISTNAKLAASVGEAASLSS